MPLRGTFPFDEKLYEALLNKAMSQTEATLLATMVRQETSPEVEKVLEKDLLNQQTIKEIWEKTKNKKYDRNLIENYISPPSYKPNYEAKIAPPVTSKTKRIRELEDVTDNKWGRFLF